jgi:hypothetical protein
VTGSTTTTARVIRHTLLSLDGFVAGADDDMQWVLGVDDVWRLPVPPEPSFGTQSRPGRDQREAPRADQGPPT